MYKAEVGTGHLIIVGWSGVGVGVGTPIILLPLGIVGSDEGNVPFGQIVGQSLGGEVYGAGILPGFLVISARIRIGEPWVAPSAILILLQGIAIEIQTVVGLGLHGRQVQGIVGAVAADVGGGNLVFVARLRCLIPILSQLMGQQLEHIGTLGILGSVARGVIFLGLEIGIGGLVEQAYLGVDCHIGDKLGHRVGRYALVVFPTCLLIIIVGIHVTENLDIGQRIGIVGDTYVASLHLDGLVELNQTAEERALGTHLAVEPGGVGKADLQQGTHSGLNQGNLAREYPEVNHQAYLTLEHNVGLAGGVVAVDTTHGLAVVGALGGTGELHQGDIETAHYRSVKVGDEHIGTDGSTGSSTEHQTAFGRVDHLVELFVAQLLCLTG